MFSHPPAKNSAVPLWRPCAVALLVGASAALPLGLHAQTAAAWPAADDHPHAVPAQLPLLGDGSAMASADERRLGDRIARELYRDPSFLDDPVLADYVQGVWQPLLAAARLRGDLTPELDERFAWQVLLQRDRSVNAFALPGGYLGLNLGLLAVVSSRDELASVLGHELSHVTQRHISRLIAKDSQQSPWLLGAMILGALAASKSPDAGSALMVGSQALTAQSQLNFSRDMEREADRVGFGMMTQAGFEAQGFVAMFDKLQQAARLNDSGSYPYLRSHPLTTERISDMQARLPLGAPQQVKANPTLQHAMMSARAQVLGNPGADALHHWQALVDDASWPSQPLAQQAATLYGATLAASQLHNLALARHNLARLQALTAGPTQGIQASQVTQATLAVRWLAAEINLAAADLPPAQLQALIAPLLPSAPNALPRPSLMLQAQAALQSRQPSALNTAVQALQSWVAQQPRDALAWQALASLYAMQNRGLRALRAEAEVQVARLDYAGALDRLRAAQDHIRAGGGGASSADHIDASIIDTRQRQIEALLRQQALDR